MVLEKKKNVSNCAVKRIWGVVMKNVKLVLKTKHDKLSTDLNP